jgi:hypothetical protein
VVQTQTTSVLDDLIAQKNGGTGTMDAAAQTFRDYGVVVLPDIVAKENSVGNAVLKDAGINNTSSSDVCTKLHGAVLQL